MDPVKTFVSFSSKDNLFVRHLLARLYILNLRPWDYSLEGSELPLGRPIDASLEAKIVESGLFVVIVSGNSTGSKHCQFEVGRPLDLYDQGTMRIVPLVDKKWLDSQREWSGSFADLKRKNLRHCKIDIDHPLDGESALQEICLKIGGSYEPPAEDTSNFPIMTRLYRELFGMIPVNEENGNSIYRRLFGAQVKLNTAVKRGDFKEAFREIQFIVTTLDYEFPNARFYYPVIAKGVCQTQCDDLDEALKTFQSLENHPLRDSNVSGAKGYVLSRQGKYREAAEAY